RGARAGSTRWRRSAVTDVFDRSPRSRFPGSPSMTRSCTCLLLLGALVAVTPARADDVKTLFDHGFYRKALAECEKQYAATPKDAETQATLSRLRSLQGDKSNAMKLAQSAVEADPKNADAQYALAEACGREAREASVLRQPGLAGKMKK